MAGFLPKVIRMLNRVVPKDRRSVYFRSTYLYPDNVEAVLETLLDRGQGHYRLYLETPVFSYADRPVHPLRSRGTALWRYLRSAYVFSNVGMFGNPAPVKSQITVNLWHGVSFKKIGFYLTPDEKPYPTSTYVVTYSDLFAQVMAKAFGVELDHVLTTGEPRNDYLFHPLSLQELNAAGIPLKEGQKFVFWMPTYRQSKYEDQDDGGRYDLGFPFLTAETLVELNDFCARQGILLALKWHGLQRLPERLDAERLGNLVFLTSESLSEMHLPLYRVLACADGLITDYSSVFINYMLLDRPMCFAYDDLACYQQNRGFMFDDVEQYMPGMRTQTFAGVLEFLRRVAAGEDPERALRHRLAPVLNRHQDGENAARLLKTLGLID